MKKISLTILIILAFIFAHVVHPESNGPVSKSILMILMAIGFLWPFALLYFIFGLFKRRISTITIQRRIVNCALILITMPFVLLSYIPPEGIFLFSPEIDTKFSNNFTISNFNKISPGETKTEVVASLGEPLSKIDLDYNPDYNEIWLYSGDGACTWHDFAWKRKQVHFKDNIVFETHTGWSFD